MSLIPSESSSFPDSFRASVGWRPAHSDPRLSQSLKSENGRLPSKGRHTNGGSESGLEQNGTNTDRDSPQVDLVGTSDMAKPSQTETNGESHAPSPRVIDEPKRDSPAQESPEPPASRNGKPYAEHEPVAEKISSPPLQPSSESASKKNGHADSGPLQPISTEEGESPTVSEPAPVEKTVSAQPLEQAAVSPTIVEVPSEPVSPPLETSVAAVDPVPSTPGSPAKIRVVPRSRFRSVPKSETEESGNESPTNGAHISDEPTLAENAAPIEKRTPPEEAR
ncbi:MAG: hypothetical protein JWO45_363, partial [Spartobacteria bacterium]|nr:hypothetical protein [Spartobacteria bacterium]